MKMYNYIKVMGKKIGGKVCVWQKNFNDSRPFGSAS